jgi:hypothetical protein
MDLVKNTDGSVDLYFGPTEPKGFEKTGFRPCQEKPGSLIQLLVVMESMAVEAYDKRARGQIGKSGYVHRSRLGVLEEMSQGARS